jgi:hypothetical protein
MAKLIAGVEVSQAYTTQLAELTWAWLTSNMMLRQNALTSSKVSSAGGVGVNANILVTKSLVFLASRLDTACRKTAICNKV